LMDKLAAVLVVAALAAVALLYVYASRPRGVARVEEAPCPQGPVEWSWAEGSTRSYALFYDRGVVKPGEPVTVKVWVFTPVGEDRGDVLKVELGGVELRHEFALRHTGMYLEACLRVTPLRPGRLILEWHGTRAAIDVAPG